MIALDIVSWIFLVLGSAFSIIGGIGIVRLPEFYSRLHGGGITDTLGAGLIVVGLMLQSDGVLVGVKLAFVLMFLMITSPTACHALAKSALIRGLKPELDGVSKSVDQPG